MERDRDSPTLTSLPRSDLKSTPPISIYNLQVNWNSMIEISFNRSVRVSANKVYRIGMVLNKVGWYPMGVCTRRVNSEGAFFTFCVGQPNDTHRDGLIRSIIFSRIENIWPA